MDRTFDDNQAVWLVGAAPDEPTPPLARDLVVDVAIIGGGFTGVSTAYRLSRRFPSLGIALIEAKRLGNGASGRNGGMMLNGITMSEDPDTVIREHALTTRAIASIEALIEEHGLRVRHRRGGCLKVLTTAKAAEEAHAFVERLGGRLPLRYVADAPVHGAHGAILDPDEGVLNGVDLIRAMRPLIASHVQIFEGTPVTKIREGTPIELVTPGGTVRANAIVLATNGYTPRLGYFTTGILPVLSHVIATDPLPESPLGALSGFSDDRARLAYCTRDDDGRLVFGGGTTAAYGYRFGNATTYDARAGDAAERALRGTLGAYFPSLAQTPIRHRWTGPLGLTLARHCAMGVLRGRIYYSLGYSGHGVVLANLAGEVLADLYADHHEPWRDAAFYGKRPTGIPPEPFRWVGYHAYTRATGRSPFKRVT